MLAAAIRDLVRGGLAVTVPLAPGVQPSWIPSGAVRQIDVGDGRSLQEVLPELMRQSDAVLIIAPESSGLLHELVSRAQGAAADGCLLLNLPPAACQIFSDKLLTARWLKQHGLPSPTTRVFDPSDSERHASRPEVLLSQEEQSGAPRGFVMKPRDGVGSEQVTVLPSSRRLENLLAQPDESASDDSVSASWVLQPQLFGEAFSIGVVGHGPGRSASILPPARQNMILDGRTLHYRGGRIPAPSPAADSMVQLARRFCESIAGWRGYVGIDAICDPDTGQLLGVVDVNPRLCTSFVGYQYLAEQQGCGSLLLEESTLCCNAAQRICFDIAGNVESVSCPSEPVGET